LSPSSSWARLTVVSTLSWLRLLTAIEKPCSATLRAKFCHRVTMELRTRRGSGAHRSAGQVRCSGAARVRRPSNKTGAGRALRAATHLAHDAETEETEVSHCCGRWWCWEELNTKQRGTGSGGGVSPGRHPECEDCADPLDLRTRHFFFLPLFQGAMSYEKKNNKIPLSAVF
jgi:hypothetical protein